MSQFDRRHFIAVVAAAAVTPPVLAQRSRSDTSSLSVTLRLDAPDRLMDQYPPMGQYPPQMRRLLLAGLTIGVTMPGAAQSLAGVKVALHAVRIERGRIAGRFASRPFGVPGGQTRVPDDSYLPGNAFLPGDMFMPSEINSPGTASFPASGQAGAVREAAQRFFEAQRIMQGAYWVALPVGMDARAQGLRF
jgi:hypothetical protein